MRVRVVLLAPLLLAVMVTLVVLLVTVAADRGGSPARSGAPPAADPPRSEVSARTRARPLRPRPVTPAPPRRDEVELGDVPPGPDHGRTPAELEAAGFTPVKLFASRQGGRLIALAEMARRLGDEELAIDSEAIGQALWAIRGPARAGAPALDDELLSQQVALMARFQVLALRHPDQTVLQHVIVKADEDLVATLSGAPRSIEHKLAGEEREQRPSRDDDDDDKRAGADVAPVEPSPDVVVQ